MPVDLTAEFEAPAAPAPVDLGSEFEAPHSTEQHAVINDSAEKARLFKRAFDPALPKDQQTAAARDVLGKMVDSFGEHFGETTKATLLKNWEDANKPLLELPTAPADTPDIPVPGSPVRLPILAGAYNGVAPLISGFTSPLSIGTLGTFGALTKLAEGAGPVARLANAGLSTIKSFFAAEMAKGAGEAAGRASVPDGKSDQEQTSDIVSTLANAGLAILAGKSATEVEPATRGAATNPNAVKEAIDGAPEKPVDIGPRDETVSTGNGIPTPKEEVMLAEQKRLVDEHLAANKPKLTEEFEAPPPESEAHQVITEELAKQEEPAPTPAAEEPASKLAEEHTAPEDGATGIRNAIVDQERKERGLPPAMEEAARDYPEVWKQASERLNEDPEAAAKLVNDINESPRATTDLESALLLHRQIDLQNQFDKLTDRVVNGAEGATPETLAADRIQLAKVSDDLLDTYNADKAGGRETGRGLNARKMMANEDFSLAKMVTVRRAANDGRPLTPDQTAEVSALHEKIKATQKAYDDYRATAEAAQKATKGTKAIRKVVVSYIGERANEARARIKARLAEGRSSSGIDPADLADYAIVGAEHLAKAADAGIDWAQTMVEEFGEKIRPHLEEIRTAAHTELDRADKAKDEASRLKSFKTRQENRAEDYNERVATNDLGPREKPEPIKLDEEAMRLRAEAERAKQEFQTAVIKDRLSNRSPAEKAADTLVRWRRGFLLSGPITLAKLTGAAVLRAATTPLEEITGAALGKALPDVFDKAPRHGGFNSHAEAQAIVSVWTKGMKDAATKLKTAKSDLDILFGKGSNVRESDVIPQSLIDMFGNLHGALKAPIMRSEFERSMVKRMEFAIKGGADVTDPMVQTKIAVAAYKDSQRAIFMQDNVLSKAFNTTVSSLENNKVNGQRSAAGKVVATGMRLMLPIVKVPSNIVAEAAEYSVGLVTGSTETALAYKRGIEKLTPEQADNIARQLKKGSLGAAALLIGYYNSKNFGGFYQQGEKRSKDDIKPGEAKIGDQKIGKALIHSSLMETMQIGAAVGRIEDSKIKGKSVELHEAIGEAALGLAEELPFVKTPIELAKLFNKNERAYTEGELVKGLVVPQALSQVAAAMDNDAKGNPISRKPRTVLEHVKTGVPGLREQVRRN